MKQTSNNGLFVGTRTNMIIELGWSNE